MYIRNLVVLIVLFLLANCGNDEPGQGKLTLNGVFIGATQLNLTEPISTSLPIDQSITLNFSTALNTSTASDFILLKKSDDLTNINLSFTNQNKTVIVFPISPLENNTIYTIELADGLEGVGGKKFAAQTINFKTTLSNLVISSIDINGTTLINSNPTFDVPLTFSAIINFTNPVTETTLREATRLAGPTSPTLNITLTNNNKTATLSSASNLRYLSKYTLSFSNKLKGESGESFTPVSRILYSVVDPTPKLPILPNDEDDDSDYSNDLLSVVQKQTFKYFWDYAEPTSGMARERNGANYVTSGGSGFGIMALIVGMERNFITQADGLARMDKILTFLESADRFHGAWPHWMHPNGDVLPFSPNDNGGDLVETAFLVEGLITFRQYISNNSISNSYNIVNRINTLWQAVEWDWYRQNDQNVLYWHWSPDKAWVMNLPIKGWNEALMVYVLAAAAPANNTIPKTVYTNGWASNMVNGSTYEGVQLPLGFPYGGPLFFTHYSFLGLDPRELNDTYTNYWTQNRNHTLINYNYCVRNPKLFAGYSNASWGLTASDNHQGYSAHSPTNDLGVITPTAALSSFPYTPEESMRALKFFYYTMGDRLWGEYGFYDAFNPTENWYANSYLAIDQGPIIIMIENYRTGLLWNLFMSAPEIQTGLTKLDINY